MIAVAAALVALAVLLVGAPATTPGSRLRRIIHRPRRPPAEPPTATAMATTSLRRPLLVAGALGGGLLLLGFSRWMLAIPLVLGVLLARHHRRPRAAAELPLVVDLLAATLRGGALLPMAVEVAAGAARTQAREQLLPVARSLEAGADAAEAWSGCAADTELAAVARICARTGVSGSSAAAELERLARRMRARRRTDVDTRSARAAVWVVLPLCLCFLPAFVLVGVVPMAIGLLEAVR